MEEDEGWSEVVGSEGPTPQCSVCDSTAEQHLLILCDTCQKRYHIGCLDTFTMELHESLTNPAAFARLT